MIGLPSFLSLCAPGKARLAIGVCDASNLGAAILPGLLSNIGKSSFFFVLRLITEIIFSHSCKLADHWVTPDYLSFEPNDTVIHNRDTCRDFQVGLRRPKVQGQFNISDASSNPLLERYVDDVSPSIDLVCHRLTMKWEPIFNIFFRYLFCRCVLRLFTPSRLVEEMTFLRACVCPRHNKQGITFRDCSELALPYQSEPYFNQFGGYNAFWALLHRYFLGLYIIILEAPNLLPVTNSNTGT